MVIAQGQIWWADRGNPTGSEAGYRRPWLVVQGDKLNASRIRTALCVPLTGNLTWANAPGKVLLKGTDTGLDRDSVANVSLTAALNRGLLAEFAGRITPKKLGAIFSGIDTVLGR